MKTFYCNAHHSFDGKFLLNEHRVYELSAANTRGNRVVGGWLGKISLVIYLTQTNFEIPSPYFAYEHETRTCALPQSIILPIFFDQIAIKKSKSS